MIWRKPLFFAFVTLILVINFVGSQNSKIGGEVYGELEKNGEARVIVKLKIEEEKGLIFKKQKTNLEIEEESKEIKEEISEEIGKENVIHIFDDHLAVEISDKELNQLNKNKNVESIEIDKPVTAFLQDSAPLINATNVWPIKILGFNITGIDETVCILDTGINFSHPDLVGTNKTCVIDCQGKACIENCSIGDDNGHGTHVAGITAASGIINGIANHARLIGVKVLDSTGSGSGSDVNAGLRWCLNNVDNYNISVISMSLGTNCALYPQFCYDNYCDDDETTTAPLINNATSMNISVIAATGNNGNYTAISTPACIRNITAVGWGNKDDTVNGNGNRNNLTDLFAPGNNINSTYAGAGCLTGCTCSGNYMVCSGTSMAAPHVSAVFALVRQFYRLQNNRILMPKEILSALNSTGKNVYDPSSGLTFQRLDALSAIVSLDETNPEVHLIQPEENLFSTSQNQTFSCNSTDSVQLKNITLQIWNSTSLYYENTGIIGGVFSEAGWSISDMGYGNYKWNCLAYDRNNNSAYATNNFTLDINRGLKLIVIGVDGFQYNHYADMLKAGVLTNITRLIGNNGWNTTHNITGHSLTSTAPGNAEIQTGLNETLNMVSDNSCENPVPDGNTTFERLEAFDSSIVTGSIYGKTTCYVPNGVLGNAWQNVDWWQNRSTYSPNVWPDGTNCDDSKDVATKATEFIGNYSNLSFYLFVYFGVPDCSGHVEGDNSINYNNSFINVDDGLGIILNSLEQNNINDSVQIIITSDHGWNEGTTGHSISDSNTITIPLITNNASMINYTTSDEIREQCEVAPTTLDYFGLSASDYQDIINNGCDSMIERDLISPNVNITSPTATTYTSSSILFNLSLNENGYCKYSLNSGAINSTLSSTNSRVWNSTQTISDGDYTVNFYCNDTSGNKNNTESVMFLVNVPEQIVSSSGGGGGGGQPTIKTYAPTIEQVSKGYTQELNTGDKVRFKFFDLNSEQHTLSLEEIGIDFVSLIIQSDTIRMNLGIGQSAKINITSSDYYDLYIKLEDITDNKAKLTIQIIKEKIPKEDLTERVIEKKLGNETRSEEEAAELAEERSNLMSIVFVYIGIVVIIGVLFSLIGTKLRKTNNKKNVKKKAKTTKKEFSLPYR